MEEKRARLRGIKMALGSHRIAEITGPMRPVTATELSPPDLLIGERESQQGVPSGGHRIGGGETMRGTSRCTRTARAHTTNENVVVGSLGLSYLRTRITTVVTMAARKMKAPNAPNAIMAPTFNLAPNGSLRSASTDRGTFTLGPSPCLILLEEPTQFN